MHLATRFLVLAALSVVSLHAAETAPDILLGTLLDFERYAESVWHDAPAPKGSGYFGDGKSGGNGGIRGTCGIALSYAVLVREYPEAKENARRLRRVEATLRYASSTHQETKKATCIDGKTWGFSWQSSLWTGSMGLACALLQDQLPTDLVKDCQRVVAVEATRLAKSSPPSGSRGDSKAEENAWNTNAMALAAAWVPKGPHDLWLKGAKNYLVNTYTVPDPGDDPLREWITTANLLPSFAMENHGFFHPSYQMVSGMSMGDSHLMARILNPAVAEELRPFAEHNVLPAWRCLERVVLDSGELGYPSGLDWSLHGYGQISYYAWLATHYQEGEAQWACEKLARLIRQRQKINGDGRYVGETTRNGFYTEAVKTRRIAIAILHYRQAEQLPQPVPPAPYVAHLPDVKLLLQRSARGFFGISYGSRIMAVVHPTATGHEDSPFVTTPHVPGLLTTGGLLPRSAEISEITTGDAGFACTLDLSDGTLSASRVRVVGTGDSLALLEIAGGDVPPKPPIAFPVGIENHPLTGRGREIQSARGEIHVPERSGKRHDLPAAVAISGRFGMIAGPGGRLIYAAPTGYNRTGAAQDLLGFQPAIPHGPRYAILLPDADLATVLRVQESVSLVTQGTTSILRYRTPGGKPAEVRLVNTTPTAPFRRLHVPLQVKVANHHSTYPGKNIVDGDPATFWVSSPDGRPVRPGDGPTKERPEKVELTFPRTTIGGILLVPRPRYGPREFRIEIDGKEVFTGKMGHSPLPIRLKAPVVGESLVLTITRSHDPSHPDNPRNLQIAEIALMKAE
ncbi:MAG: discoidin domain-containing protein [Victivallales bacterium]|nr:discoidin domain-containing protein [Victivallales bacterium]